VTTALLIGKITFLYNYYYGSAFELPQLGLGQHHDCSWVVCEGGIMSGRFSELNSNVMPKVVPKAERKRAKFLGIYKIEKNNVI